MIAQHLMRVMMGTAAGAPPGPQYSDDFNRANSGSLGADWIETGDGNLAISSNQLIINGGAGSSARRAFWATGLTTDDHYIQFDIISGIAISMYVRCDTNNPSTGYECYWDSGSGGNIAIRRGNPLGSLTTLTSTTGVGVITGKVFRLEIQGTAVRIKIDGTTALSTTDSTYSSGKFVGIRLDIASDTVDNFEASNL